MPRRVSRSRVAGVLIAIGIISVATVLGATVFTFLFGFVDEALNGAFIDWIAEQFLSTWNLNEFGVSAEVALDTVGTKYFFFELGILVIFLMATVAVVSSVLYARRRVRQTREQAAALLEEYMDGELDARSVFPEGFEDLALQASQVKQTMIEHERALRDEAARKNDLITYLAHDLKTPLTSIIGYLSLLDEIPEMPLEQRARYTGIALDKARRLERLINEFFDITRYNLQHIELELAPVDLSFLLVQMADEFYPLLQAHGNTVAVTVLGHAVDAENPGAPLMVMADAERLARVFNNVLKNAIAYSDADTPITVEVTVEEDGLAPVERAVAVRITDHGATIPSHKLRAIFDKFFRADDARASSTGGAGLGLAIAKEIVELHGGSISAQSARGETTFSVLLPFENGETEDGESSGGGTGSSEFSQ